MDGHGWRPLQPVDPLLSELRQLCRDEIALIEERTALINQLQHALSYYYPTALEAFEDWALPPPGPLSKPSPHPRSCSKRDAANGRDGSRQQAIPCQKNQKRLELFAHADEFGTSSATTLAKSLLALAGRRCCV